MNQWIVTGHMEILNIRKLTIAAVAFVLCAAPQTRGINAYLKQTGPSPLRFNAVGLATTSFALPESLAERHTSTNTTQVASTTDTSAGTNTVTAQVPPSAVTSSNAVVYTTTAPQNGTATTAPASDMLVVSPQMLTEFFKPVTDGTNSPGTVVVPVPVGFTPPSATPPSRATYHSP